MKYAPWILGIGALLVLAPIKWEGIEVRPAPVAATASVIVGGDMMFDRYIRQVSGIVGPDWPFSCIDNTLASADLVMANLEGPITDNPSVSLGSASGTSDNYVFTFPPATAATLLRHNITVVNIGNNHILNFGQSGLRSTEIYLAASGVQWFDESHVATTSVKGIPLAFINYNQFAGEDASGLIYQSTREIQEAKANGSIPIVYTHWGEEYQLATDGERSLAHQFIDAGAEMVIGSHPHIVQEYEQYQGKSIYYSLGNFIFDQYWNDEVSHGLLLKLTIAPSGVTGVKEIPIEMERDGRTCLALP